MRKQAALRPFLSPSWRVVEHVEAWHLLERLEEWSLLAVLDLQALPSAVSQPDVSSSSSEEHDIGLELARFSAETDCLGGSLVEVEAGLLLNKASSVLLVCFV